jgi:hypothetical protein
MRRVTRVRMTIPDQEEATLPINIKAAATDAKVRALVALTG